MLGYCFFYVGIRIVDCMDKLCYVVVKYVVLGVGIIGCWYVLRVGS